MNNKFAIRNGFSLAEMVIVVTIFSFVMAVIYSALYFTSETTRKRNLQGELELTGHRAISEMIYELAGARDIFDAKPDQIYFVSAYGKLIRYALKDEKLTKNGILLHSQDTKIDSLVFTYFSNKKLDTNGDGQISSDDFIEISGFVTKYTLTPDIQLENAAHLKLSPDSLDINQDGLLEPNETASIAFVQISILLTKKDKTVHLRSSTALRMHRY